MYASGSPARRRATSSSKRVVSNGSSNRDTKSLHVMPSACAASSSASCRGRSVRSNFELQLLEWIDDRVELAVHHLLDAVHRDSDAVIGHAVLREVVGADLLRAVTRADLRTALGGE